MEIRRILVVDDDDDIRTIAALALQQVGGWDVVLAASAAEALQLLAEAAPDLILMDVAMPGMDGPTALAAIQAAPAGSPQPPVIFITADSTRAETASYLAAGAAGVIPKPFNPLELPDKVRQILGAVAAPEGQRHG